MTGLDDSEHPDNAPANRDTADGSPGAESPEASGSQQRARPKRRRSKRKHPNWPVRFLLLGLLLSFVLVCFVVPVVSAAFFSGGLPAGRIDLLYESMLNGALTWFVTVWVFFFGACLGSFLNVVAYRVPNRITLLGSSRCPWCLTPIEGRYNIPILGWFLLRGRCASCRLPISTRYLWVEIIAGGLLLWLFARELVSGGANLTTERDFQITRLFRSFASGQWSELLAGDWSLVRLFLGHALVGYAALTAALMRLDGFRIPWSWKIFHLLVLIALVGFWPADLEFAHSRFIQQHQPAWLVGWGFVISGLFTGWLVGWQIQLVVGDRLAGIGYLMSLVGIVCGIHATLRTGLLFLASLGFLSACRCTRPVVRQPLFVLLPVFLIQIGFWRHFDQWPYWPGPDSGFPECIAALIPLTTAAILSTWLRRKKPAR